MAMPMMSPGGGQLDGPPPSPTPMDGQQGPFSMQGLVPPAQQVPSGQMPPEVLTGIISSAATIGQLLDSFAQVTPDKAAALALIKDLLQSYLADLMASGAGATSPTASGSAFAGGGIDRGIAGAGTV